MANSTMMNITEESIAFMKTESLIIQVQRCHTELEFAKFEKKDSLKRYQDMRREIGSLRYILGNRLRKMDRFDPKFFPVASMVEYHNQDMSYSDRKIGVVTGHNDPPDPFPRVHVQFKGDPYVTAVEPSYLKLLFIRG